jgi:hypothetical protein
MSFKSKNKKPPVDDAKRLADILKEPEIKKVAKKAAKKATLEAAAEASFLAASEVFAKASAEIAAEIAAIKLAEPCTYCGESGTHKGFYNDGVVCKPCKFLCIYRCGFNIHNICCDRTIEDLYGCHHKSYGYVNQEYCLYELPPTEVEEKVNKILKDKDGEINPDKVAKILSKMQFKPHFKRLFIS